MSKALVIHQSNILNQITYYNTSKVYPGHYYDTYKDKYVPLPQYPYIDYSGESFIETEKPHIVKVYNTWSTQSKILQSYIVDLDFLFSTIEYTRKNSNIYKNIFSHLMFDVYNIQDKLIAELDTNKQLNNIIQFNHNFNKYDLVHINNNGFYEKSIANSEETYSVTGIVYDVIDNNNFVLMTNGIIDNIFDFESKSGILYLSDTIPGKFTTYENIHNTFYTPIGFNNNDKIVINIMDSSVGDILDKYQENIISQDFSQLSEQDLDDIIQEVLNNS